MKNIGLVLYACLLCMACSGSGDTVTDSSASVDPVPPAPPTRELLSPGALSLRKTTDGLVLSWTDRSTLEEGYLIERKHASTGKTRSFFLPANSSSWTDTEHAWGLTQYTVMAYWHMERSEASRIQYEEYAPAQVTLLALERSCHMVAARVKIVSDGGLPVRCGVRCSREGELLFEQTFPEPCRTDQQAWLLFEALDPAFTYEFLPWAESAEGRVYGTPKSARLEAAPQPLTLPWETLALAGLPEDLILKRISTDALGHRVNMWCAVANLTTGSLELRTTLASALTEPGTHIRESLSPQGEVLVLVNGGYFASPAVSYSYVCDRGLKKASNVSLLTRTRAYGVTRGFFGVDETGLPAIGWQSGDDFLTRPLPVYDGGPVLSLPSDHPRLQAWTPYSAIGGGPVLIKDGRYCFDFLQSQEGFYLSNHELFQADIYAKGLRAPRTAIGSDAAGRVILLVADGRGSGGSTGLTLEELARVMAGLGCVNVMNLDGGGSSMFLTGEEGTLHNAPSDGRQRKILSYVSIMR